MDRSHVVQGLLTRGLSFRGRATRREFWLVHGSAAVLGAVPFVVLAICDETLASAPDEAGPAAGLALLLWLVLLLAPPVVAVQVRRLHDAGSSGWWWWLLAVLGPASIIGLGLAPTQHREPRDPVARPTGDASSPAPCDVVTAVSAERLLAALDAAGIRHLTSADGAALASFTTGGDGTPLLEIDYRVDVDVVSVRGALATTYGADHAAHALALADRWHRQCRWPTGHLSWSPGGQLQFRVVGEVHHPVSAGATDAQLVQVVRSATSGIGQFTTTVHEALVTPGPRPAPPSTAIDLEAWLDD